MDEHGPEPRIRMEAGFEESWPGASALATECLLNAGLLVNLMARLGEATVRTHGFSSLAAFDALATLDRAGGPLPPSAIAERMLVSRPTITGVIRSLERSGLTRRRPHSKDRRMVLIVITRKGRTLVGQVRSFLHRGERQWMGALTSDEQLAFLRMVAKLQANAPQR